VPDEERLGGSIDPHEDDPEVAVQTLEGGRSGRVQGAHEFRDAQRLTAADPARSAPDDAGGVLAGCALRAMVVPAQQGAGAAE
jgi:hypothetical protein